MINAFTPITLSQREKYKHFWENTPQHSIDYAYANLWGWCDYYELQWHMGDKLCWIHQQRATPCLWAPVGDWSTVDWSQESLLRDGATIIRVPESLVHILEEALPGRVHAEEARGQWEYLYSKEDLATLPGNRFHKKRNHVNAFKKIYGEPDYRPMNTSSMEDILALQDEWCKWHECSNSSALQAENDAINRVLSHWHDIAGLVGGALYVNNMVVAFSVGEKLDDMTLGVHYEKGRDGFRGVYQCINTLFAAREGFELQYINRAQDLDEEGLRQAKQSYLPVDFLRKYTLNIDPA